MGQTLYLECASGISGDMTVASLLDLGASEERLRAALATLPVGGFEVRVSRVTKAGLDACDFDVALDAAHENHDHDMAWLYGHLDAEAGAHVHSHEHEHAAHTHHHGAHCHHHDHAHGHHHHEHRSLADVTAIIDASGLTDRAKQTALRIFGKLAEAEAKAHGATPETVHFHEVGAVDSIVDVCSVAVCLDDLDVTDVVVTELAEGRGTIRCAHGIMPVPVPAVVNVCSANDIALVPSPVAGELVTPTGASIVAAVRTATRLPKRYRIKAVGLGAGKRSYEGATGILRALLLDTAASTTPDADGRIRPTEPAGNPEDAGYVTKLETDLDDCTGEALSRTIELLMAAGAREAHAIPLVMKKGRPGWQLEVICDACDVARLEQVIFETTTTIGIRSQRMARHRLPREASSVKTSFGEIATKRVVLPDGSVRTYPEYDSVVAASERTGASFQDVFRAVEAAATL